MKLIISEEDHRRIDAVVAEHDPADWLVTNRVRLFSEEDAEFYAGHARAELRGSLQAALLTDALAQAISELGGGDTVHGDIVSIETEVREMLSHLGDFHDQRWERIFNGTTDNATDEDWSHHHDAARAELFGAVV